MINNELRGQLEEFYQLKRKESASVAWFNPCAKRVKDEYTGMTPDPKTIYIGNRESVPEWRKENAVINVPKFMQMQELFEKGDIDEDKKTFSPYVSSYWQDRANDYISAKRTYGTGTAAEFTSIEVTNVLATLLNTEYKIYILPQAVTLINTPNIELNIDSYNKAKIKRDVGEMEATDTMLPTYSRQNIKLKKDVGHIALQDELFLRPHYHDIQANLLQNMAGEFLRIKQLKVAAEVTTASTVSGGGLWTAYTTDHSTVNPYEDFGLIGDVIVGNHGGFDRIISHDKVYRAFLANTNVKGPAYPVPEHDPSFDKVKAPPGISNKQWFIGNEATATEVVGYGQDAVALFQGPISAANYRMEIQGVDGTLARDFNKVKIINSGRIRKITGVVS